MPFFAATLLASIIPVVPTMLEIHAQDFAGDACYSSGPASASCALSNRDSQFAVGSSVRGSQTLTWISSTEADLRGSYQVGLGSLMMLGGFEPVFIDETAQFTIPMNWAGVSIDGTYENHTDEEPSPGMAYAFLNTYWPDQSCLVFFRQTCSFSFTAGEPRTVFFDVGGSVAQFASNDVGDFDFLITPTALVAPEPSSVGLLLLSATGAVFVWRKRRKQSI